MTTTIRVETIPPISRTEARTLASSEYERVIVQLRSLAYEDWSQPTDCPGWDVRAMAGHTVGMIGDFTSLRTILGRMRQATKVAKQSGQQRIDAMTAAQVAELAGLTTDELIAKAERDAPQAARWRASAPRLLRAMPSKEQVGGQTETWRLGYLFDVILTRDPWMHRVDIARATGRELELTADHDGRIVADAVAEWARRHGQPFTLHLTGPAGGEFTAGDGAGEAITIDAVELCRTLSGRTPGQGLLSQEVPF